MASSKESAQQNQKAVELKVHKLAQNTHYKELEISDGFEAKPTHPCLSFECGASSKESAQHNEKAVERKVHKIRAKLAQNTHNKELEISDGFETKPTHPCPSLDCGKHRSVWPRQKKVHNKMKRP